MTRTFHLRAAHHAHCAAAYAMLDRDANRAERIMCDHAEAAVGSEAAFRRLGIGPRVPDVQASGDA